MKTTRRMLLDRYLSDSTSLMRGHVIDIGGKREKKRGDFSPPISRVKSWKYVNIDESTNPDFRCSAESIPVNDASFDTALLCEVLEHLENPEKVLREAFRILKNGGKLIMSTPFLFHIHSDPHDFQRWTETKITLELESMGFSDLEITPMGGPGSVINDLLYASFSRVQNKYFRYLGYLTLRAGKPFFRLLDIAFSSARQRITTGYFVIASK